MDLRTWVSDNVIKLFGMSDSTIVDFVIATAEKAKSAGSIHQKLGDVLEGDEADFRKFAEELYERAAKKQTKSSASTTKDANREQEVMAKKKYALVDMGEEELGPAKVKEVSSKSHKKRKDRHDGSERDGKGESREKRAGIRFEGSRGTKLRRRNSEDHESKWADQYPSEAEEQEDEEAAAEASTPVSGDAAENEQAREDEAKRDKRGRTPDDAENSEDAERRDKKERDEFAKRLKNKDKAGSRDEDQKTSSHMGRRDLADPNMSMSDIRQLSRQAYLGKRERERIALFRQQVEDEAEEERHDPTLSKRELKEFARNRELLRLMESRHQIDDHKDGYAMPEDYITEKGKMDRKRKEQAMNERYVDRDKYGREVFISEVDQWEAEQSAKAKNQVKRPRYDIRDDDEWEYVVDPNAQINFVMDEMLNTDKRTPEQRKLQEQIDEAEAAAKTMDDIRKSLPVYQYRDTFLQAVRDYQIMVIVGETGSGKTTQLTQYLVEAGIVGGKTEKKVGCTQPRRVAAMSVAKRVSEEMGTKLGDEVGYSIRFEDKTSKKTVIHYQTDGHLLKTLQTDSELNEYGVIMIDEAHERTLQTDILLALLKDLAKFRPDFKLLISSATLDAQKFQEYFQENNEGMIVPILNIPGRAHPVEIYYSPAPESNADAAALTTIFQIHLAQPDGDILVFLSGQDQIESLEESIMETTRKIGKAAKELIVCPIYSTLDSALQAKIFDPTPPNCRKVVLATNIAETSITIDGIVYVIDTGFVKENVYSPKNRMSSLLVTPCSRAAANQRAGRAGRNRHGYAFRLFTKHAFMTELPEQTTPEVLRENLSSTVLMLKAMGIHDLIKFDFLDPPHPDALIASLEELYALQALNSKGEVTKMGRQMAEVPLSPSESRALIAGGQEGCTEEIITILAMLGESAALFLKPKEKRMLADAAHKRFAVGGGLEGGDHWVLLNIYTQWVDSDYSYVFAKDNFLQARSLTRARDVREQLIQMCDRIEVPVTSAGISNIPLILRALTKGFFMNCAASSGDSYRTVKHKMGVFLHPSSALKEERPRMVVFHEVQLTSKEFMRNCYPVKPEMLNDIAPHFFKSGELQSKDPRERMPRGRGLEAGSGGGLKK